MAQDGNIRISCVYSCSDNLLVPVQRERDDHVLVHAVKKHS